MSQTTEIQEEAPEGYKQVQLGPRTLPIPTDWKIKRVDEVTENLDKKREPMKSSERESGEIPYYGATGQVDSVSGYLFDEKLVLVGEDGADWSPFGGTSYIISGKSWVNNHVHVLRCTKIVEEFLSNYLDYIEMRQVITGTNRGKLNQSELNQFPVLYTPLPEQRRIADILSTVDEQIQQTDEMIQETEALRRGIVHDFIHEHEKRDTSVERFGPFELEIPMTWDTKTIESICDYRQLGTDDRTDPDGNPVSLIKMGNLTIGSWDFRELEKMNRDDELMEKYQLKEGDLLFNTRNSPELVGKTAVWNADFPAVFDNNLMRLRFTDDIYNSIFVNIILSSGFGRRYLSSLVHGTTSVAAIYWKDLATLRMPLPPTKEQIEIVESVSAVDKKLNKERETKQKLQDLKRGLMQDLLTGQVRVNTD